jgi:uncharacterized protein (DUF3084 family)
MFEEAANHSRLRLLGWLAITVLVCGGTLLLLPQAMVPFLLALASGGIAFLGDWIGRRIGKRRYTLFQLRPRITATVVTILTGMFIAGFLQVLIFTTSENAQQAFFRFREFKAEFEDLQIRYQHLKGLKENLEKRIPALEEEDRKLRQARDRARQESQQAQRERKEAERQLRKTRRAFQDLQGQLATLRSQVGESRKKLQLTEARLQGTEAALRQARADLETTQADWEKANQELKAAEKELANAEKMVTDTWQDLRKVEADLKERQATVASLEAQRDQLLAQRDQLLGRIAEAQAEIDSLQQRFQTLGWAVAVAGDLQTYLEREVIYHAGESLVQAVVDATRPLRAIRERLDDVLEAASTQAALRGAGKGQNGRYVTASRLVNVGGEFAFIPEEDLLAAIARSLMERRESVVVQILAARNTLEGEQVNVEFARPQPNRRIFRANDEITHRIVDGTLSDADIYTELLSMLQDVRAEARSRGLIPTLPGGKFGEIPHTELFPVLHQVQAARGPVRVRVLAARETWTADPLQIRFVVGEDRS